MQAGLFRCEKSTGYYADASLEEHGKIIDRGIVSDYDQATSVQWGCKFYGARDFKKIVQLPDDRHASGSYVLC